MAKLLIQESDGTREFELLSTETALGRGKANALRLPHPSISNRHCVIQHTPSGYEIHDLESSNGVLINAKRVRKALLKDGDRVELGEIRITFIDPPSAEATSEATKLTVRMHAGELAEFHAKQEALAPPRSSAPAVGMAATDRDAISTILSGRGAGANLRGVNLRGAALEGADLERADLNEANLSGADLKSANLSGATLRGANLEGADLRKANLERANLRSANLKGAALQGANLEGANLEGTLQ